MNYMGKNYFSSYLRLIGQPYSIKDNYVKKTDYRIIGTLSLSVCYFPGYDLHGTVEL